MRVLVDATGASKGGMQTYVRGLFHAWSELFRGDVLRVVVTDDLGPSVREALSAFVDVASIGKGSLAKRIMAQQALMPIEARRFDPDVVFCMVPIVPLLSRKYPTVCVAHDFRHYHRPQEFSFVQRTYRHISYRASLRKATLVIANSKATATEVQALSERQQGDVKVIYMGTDHHLFSRAEPDEARGHAVAFGHWTNKQPDVSVRTWGYLRERMPTLETGLEVVGVPNEDQPALRGLAVQCGV